MRRIREVYFLFEEYRGWAYGPRHPPPAILVFSPEKQQPFALFSVFSIFLVVKDAIIFI
jgi:hypothetical protein